MEPDARAGGHTAPRPVATYRFQLTPEHDLDTAAAVVPYLAELGISHLYLSPIFEAVPGSTHGYDGTDPTRVREELGGRPALDRLRAVLDGHDMGLLLDIVPNHLATHATNPQWWATLRDGQESDAARTFDIDWSGGRERPAGTVLLPVLNRPVAETVAAGELAVVAGPAGAELAVQEHRFPLRAPEDAGAGTSGRCTTADLGDGADVDLPVLLDAQHYRLAAWRVAEHELSYRRFFDNVPLIGVRVEDEAVFEQTHSLVLELVADGVVQGLRVDHIDGLADPKAYLDRLADRTDRVWVVVEKILGDDEQLDPGWRADGTTGYEHGASIGSVLARADGEQALIELYRAMTADERSWAEAVADDTREVLHRLFRPELCRLTALFATALEEPDDESLLAAVAAVVVSFDVYRMYAPPSGPMPPGASERLAAAAARARAARPAHSHLIDRLEAVLRTGQGGGAGLEARTRLAQLTGPVTAKGVEDTALYRWVALPGDVGAAPVPSGCSLDAFHDAARVATRRPSALVTTSTHDSKRSEDVRSRLRMLAEMPDEWAGAVRSWSAAVAEATCDGGLVDGRTELLLWQTLVGAWPIDAQRIRAHLRKAVREAKLHTSWTAPDDRYEAAVDHLVDAVYADDRLVMGIEAFGRVLDRHARVDSLAQLLLKLTHPGVPDIYQGNELWRFDLTDPDDRRGVDWDRRRALLALAAHAEPADVWPEPREGLAKLWLLHRALAVRAARHDGFRGDHRPLAVEGSAAAHAVSFVRGDEVVVLVPRWPVTLERAGGWGDTACTLPDGVWADALAEGRTWTGRVAVGDLCAPFPVALLTRRAGP